MRYMTAAGQRKQQKCSDCERPGRELNRNHKTLELFDDRVRGACLVMSTQYVPGQDDDAIILLLFVVIRGWQ
ncbi:hypothetical protein GCK32_008603 [Trichostrongylus colubriformis]|uniref:Uncharacterized protein n=1 Tax=Trichostrongylus colubriformis TaxID=6319 RepID=A0AAN8F7Q5_TRICO